MESWTISDWFMAFLCAWLVVLAIVKLLLKRISDNNRRQIRMLMTMANDEFKGLELTDEEVFEIKALKKSIRNLVKENKDGSPMRVRRLIACYYNQMIDLKTRFLKKRPPKKT